jgi:hypothetical protein
MSEKAQSSTAPKAMGVKRIKAIRRIFISLSIMAQSSTLKAESKNQTKHSSELSQSKGFP